MRVWEAKCKFLRRLTSFIRENVDIDNMKIYFKKFRMSAISSDPSRPWTRSELDCPCVVLFDTLVLPFGFEVPCHHNGVLRLKMMKKCYCIKWKLIQHSKSKISLCPSIRTIPEWSTHKTLHTNPTHKTLHTISTRKKNNTTQSTYRTRVHESIQSDIAPNGPHFHLYTDARAGISKNNKRITIKIDGSRAKSCFFWHRNKKRHLCQCR